MQTSSHTHILKNETQHIWNVVHVTVYARKYAPRSRFYTISELKNKSRVNFCILKLICYVAWILRFCIGKMWNASSSSMFHHLCLLNSCFIFLVELTTILVFYAGPIWKETSMHDISWLYFQQVDIHFQVCSSSSLYYNKLSLFLWSLIQSFSTLRNEKWSF